MYPKLDTNTTELDSFININPLPTTVLCDLSVLYTCSHNHTNPSETSMSQTTCMQQQIRTYTFSYYLNPINTKVWSYTCYIWAPAQPTFFATD